VPPAHGMGVAMGPGMGSGRPAADVRYEDGIQREG